MSAFGTKRTFLMADRMSAFGGKADIEGRHETAPGPNLETGTAS